MFRCVFASLRMRWGFRMSPTTGLELKELSPNAKSAVKKWGGGIEPVEWVVVGTPRATQANPVSDDDTHRNIKGWPEGGPASNWNDWKFWHSECIPLQKKYWHYTPRKSSWTCCDALQLGRWGGGGSPLWRMEGLIARWRTSKVIRPQLCDPSKNQGRITPGCCDKDLGCHLNKHWLSSSKSQKRAELPHWTSQEFVTSGTISPKRHATVWWKLWLSRTWTMGTSVILASQKRIFTNFNEYKTWQRKQFFKLAKWTVLQNASDHSTGFLVDTEFCLRLRCLFIKLFIMQTLHPSTCRGCSYSEPTREDSMIRRTYCYEFLSQLEKHLRTGHWMLQDPRSGTMFWLSHFAFWIRRRLSKPSLRLTSSL